MRLAHAGLLASFLLAFPAVAQEAPTPPKEMQKFEKMIGTWEGSGTVIGEPGEPGMPWTATVRAQRILDGFFVQEDSEVRFGADMPTPLRMRNIHGFDRETGKYVTYSASNMGGGKTTEGNWIGDAYLIRSNNVENGVPVIERTITRFGKDGYEFKIERGIGLADIFAHVQGKMKRSNVAEAAATPAGKGVSFMEMPVAAEMGKLTRCCGVWDMKGTMVPAPGADAVPISGRETVEEAFGGHVQIAHVVGDPAPGDTARYEAFGFLSWDPADGSYDHFSCNNMGAVGRSEGRWQGDDALVFTASGLQFGVPVVNRMTMTFGAGGAMMVTGHAITGTGEPARVFTGDFRRPGK